MDAAMALGADLERYRREREFEIAEISVRQRERILKALGQQGSGAADLSAAIRNLVSATDEIATTAHGIAANTQSIAVEVSRMAAVADWAFPAIVAHLAAAADRLGGLEEMLSHPAETKAAEFYRNGTYALASEWWEDAVADLSEAVRLYRYNPRTWLNLGIAQQRSGSTAAAVEAYRRCAQYGVSIEPALAAGAAIAAASLCRSAGRADASEKILRDFAEKIDTCAELHLALAVHHNDQDHLVKALMLAPDSAVDARIGNATGLEEAAALVCGMVDGPVQRLRAVERSIGIVAESGRNIDLDGLRPSPSHRDLPPDGVDALFMAHIALPDAVAIIVRMADEIRDEYRRRQAAADSAATDRDTARADWFAAAQKAEQFESTKRDLASGIVRCLETRMAAEKQVKFARHQAQRHRVRLTNATHPTHRADLKARIAKAERLVTHWEVMAQQYVVKADQLWHQARQLAASVSNDFLAYQGVRAAKERLDASGPKGDSRVEAVQRDLWTLLIEPARRQAQEAQARYEATIDPAQAAVRSAAEAGAVATGAEALVETARRAAAPPDRILPFDLPSEWNDIDV